MKNLRDQLLKAGLVNKKAVQRAKADQQRERKAKGVTHNEAQAEAAARRAALTDEQQQQKREKDRAIEAERQAAQATRDQWRRAAELIHASALSVRRPSRTWFFVCPDGVIRSLEVSDELGADLERGAAAIVARVTSDSAPRGTGPWCIVPRATVERLGELAPALVAFDNRREV